MAEKKPISDKQRYYLKQNGYTDEGLNAMSAGEAYKIIKAIKDGTNPEGAKNGGAASFTPKSAPSYDYAEALKEVVKIVSDSKLAIGQTDIIVELLRERHAAWLSDRINAEKMQMTREINQRGR